MSVTEQDVLQPSDERYERCASSGFAEIAE